MKEKGFGAILTLLIFLILLGLLGGIYILSKSGSKTPKTAVVNSSPTPSAIPDTTVDWHNFFSEDYTFSFRYPPDFKFEEVNAVVEGEKVHYFQLSSPELRIMINSSIGTIDKAKTDENITLDGKPAVLSEYPIYQGTDTVGAEVNFPINGKNNRITLDTFPSNSRVLGTEDLLLFRKILSSFLFIDQGPVNADGTKTFTDPAGVYSIQYPANWAQRGLHGIADGGDEILSSAALDATVVDGESINTPGYSRIHLNTSHINNQDLESLADSYASDSKVISRGSIKINGLTGVKLVIQTPSSDYATYYLIQNTEKTSTQILAIINSEGTNPSKSQAQLEKIVNSFKFNE